MLKALFINVSKATISYFARVKYIWQIFQGEDLISFIKVVSKWIIVIRINVRAFSE